MKKAISTLVASACLLSLGLQWEGRGVSRGCAMAPPRSFDVDITDEAALIVWNAASQTEHFIRNANFETSAADFGFLVPTPSVPSLHESGGRILSELAQRTVAKVERRPVMVENFRLFKPGTGLDFFLRVLPDVATNAMQPPMAGAVQVIDEVRVAGYDATILKATDAAELLKWLEEHQYAARPALLEWLDAYTQQGWYVTAFKVSQADASTGSRAVARPVRMTFKTDRPFYPYREPADARSEQQAARSRLLRLYVLSDQRMEAHIGESEAMPATTVWANKLPDHDVHNLNRLFPESKESTAAIVTNSTLFLTEFEDHSSPRQGTDELYLLAASDRSAVERPRTIVQYKVNTYAPDLHKWPFWFSGFGIVGGFWFWRRRRIH